VNIFVAGLAAGGAIVDPNEGAGTTGAGVEAAGGAKVKLLEIPPPPSPPNQ